MVVIEPFTVLASELHDGYLIGLAIEREMAPSSKCTLTLKCMRTDGIGYSIVVPNVERINASPFLIDNIIFEIRIWDSQQCTLDLLSQAQHPALSKTEQFLANELERIRRDNCILIELDSSHGCQLYAIANCRIQDVQCQADT